MRVLFHAWRKARGPFAREGGSRIKRHYNSSLSMRDVGETKSRKMLGIGPIIHGGDSRKQRKEGVRTPMKDQPVGWCETYRTSGGGGKGGQKTSKEGGTGNAQPPATWGGAIIWAVRVDLAIRRNERGHCTFQRKSGSVLGGGGNIWTNRGGGL